jgi:hypothetical protein
MDRPSSTEPMISHVKQYHRLGRNYLKDLMQGSRSAVGALHKAGNYGQNFTPSKFYPFSGKWGVLRVGYKSFSTIQKKLRCF